MIKNPQFSGNAIGLILPNDILDVEKQEFEAILQNLTKADQELKQYEECLEYSEQVSEGLKKGAEYVGRGMVKGAIKSSEWMYLGRYFSEFIGPSMSLPNKFNHEMYPSDLPVLL